MNREVRDPLTESFGVACHKGNHGGDVKEHDCPLSVPRCQRSKLNLVKKKPMPLKYVA